MTARRYVMAGVAWAGAFILRTQPAGTATNIALVVTIGAVLGCAAMAGTNREDT